MRRKSIDIIVGNVRIGGNNPITVQSMTNAKGLNKTLKQVRELEKKGCEIIRISVPDSKALSDLREIKKQISIPIVADIHFNYKLAIQAASIADKIRINPGNIGNEEKIKKIINAAKNNSIPIRIGVNSGSIEKEFLDLPIEKAMVRSCIKWIKFFEENDFRDLILSLKSTGIDATIKANIEISRLCKYPIHLGVTESGAGISGIIASSIAIGTLLRNGIGDTIRVSLSANPIEEVKVGTELLKQLGLRKGVRVISCPTCARAELDVIKIANKVSDAVRNIKKNITVAVMGCPVNGLQEAAHADIGITANSKEGLLFKKGKIISKIPKEKIIEELFKYLP